jgi:hypothetical protein
MVQRGDRIDLLRTGNLRDYPYTTYLKTEDYIRAAENAEQELKQPCRINIRYTPDAVAPEQSKWAYAHVDVIEEDTVATAERFREILKAWARMMALCESCDSILSRDEVGDAGIGVCCRATN